MTPCYIAVDTETTGFDRERHSTITQVAGVAIEAATGRLVSQGTLRVRVTDEDIARFSQEAQKVQKWTPELNAQGQPLAAVREQFHSWLNGFQIVSYIAHSARFDRVFFDRLKLHVVERPWLCTKEGMINLERKRRINAFENHKLMTLAKACGYVQTDAHQALDDVLACANGYLWLRGHGVPDEDMRIN